MVVMRPALRAAGISLMGSEAALTTAPALRGGGARTQSAQQTDRVLHTFAGRASQPSPSTGA